MSNILNLDLDNNEAVVLASPYQNINDRKEIYLKYLIIAALKSQSDIVDVQDSLFYSRKFYSLTRLFDFYVNNNVFDLIILKPDENEAVFDIVQDEIHSNIYGYAVARVGKDFKSAELLGYFMAKDFGKVVNGKTINVSALLPINDFEDVEIMDSQMSLEDVSERFFELLSGFMDDDLDEAGLAEFACLLYNSFELREVFSEIGRFDSLCEDMSEHAYLLNDEFLSVFDGEMAKEILEKQEKEKPETITSEEKEEYSLNNLSDLVEDEPLSLDTDEIDLSSDLELLSEFESDKASTNLEIESTQVDKVEETTSDEENDFQDEETTSDEEDDFKDEETLEEILDEDNIEELAIDDDLDELLIAPEELEDDVENEKASISDEEVHVEENIEESFELDLDTLVNDEPESESIDELLDSEDEENVSDIDFEETKLEDSLNEDLDIVSLEMEEPLLNEEEEESSVDVSLELNNDETLEGEFEELSIDGELELNLEEFDEKEPVVEEKTKNQSRLATELASLSLKLEGEDDEKIDEPSYDSDESFEIVETVNQLEELEIVEVLPAKKEEQEENTQSEDINIEQDVSLELEFESSETQNTKMQDTVKTTVYENKEQVESEVLNDELMGLLNDSSVIDVDVDDEEIAEILQEQEDKLLENVQEEITENQKNNNLESLSVVPQAVDAQTQEDLSLLYSQKTMSEDVNKDAEIDELNALYKVAQEKAAKKKKGMLIVAAVALLVVLGMTLAPQPKNSKVSNKTTKARTTVKEKEIVEKEPAIPAVKPVASKKVVDDFDDDGVLSAGNVVATQETKIETSLTNQVGGAPVVLRSVAWQVPTSIAKDVVFNKYLQIAGKNIKLNLASDLLETDDFAYNNRIKVSMTVKNNMPVKNIKIVESSGSKNVDEIVLQSIKQTLKYINTPVMSMDSGDREVILVISI